MYRDYPIGRIILRTIKYLLIHLLLSSITFFNSPAAFAQAPAGARKLAEEFLVQNTGPLKSANLSIFDIVAGYKDIWIFESSSLNSFVLVKEEDQFRIAGYSFGNKFFKDGDISGPARLCLDAINDLSVKGLAESRRLKSYPESIEPMLQTKWGQDCFFNHACPTDFNGYCDHVAAGCIPVAMGQIMKHYSKFNKFILTEKFESNIYPDETVILGIYDWDKMADEPICTDLEVSRFLYHLGVITKVLYGPEITSTSTYNAWVAFGKMTYLGSQRISRSSTNQETWTEMFYKNISQFMPVYVAGSGHAFVCDGYDSNGFFHFNLGWGGAADGYYPLIGTGSPFISEAMFDLKPHSLVLPPVNLYYQAGDLKDSLKWSPHPYAETLPFKYRLYQDDKQFAETDKTSFPTAAFEHGRHMIKVSAWYINGESRWIGPVEIYNPGPVVNVVDDNLRIAMNMKIGLEKPEAEAHIPTADELISIRELIIDKPVTDFSGIEYCRGLLRLELTDNLGLQFDLSKLKYSKKLKVLNIQNAEINNLSELAMLDQLVYLELNNIPIAGCEFLSETTDLLSLSITNTPLPALDSIIRLGGLEYIDFHNTGLESAWFVDQLPALKRIMLSDNRIKKFQPVNKLNKLRFLNLNGNILEEMKFLENMPNIVSLEMDNNKVKSLELFKKYNDLESLSFVGNEILLVKANQLQSKLAYINLSGNHIENIDRLAEFAPGIRRLNLKNNNIDSLWDKSFQHLEFLDLSQNFLKTIDEMILNPSMVHLDLSGNLIGDFYPLTINSIYDNYVYLDLTGNPGSKESLTEFFPLFRTEIDTLYLDESYSMYCPSYPSPQRNTQITDNSVMLSWDSENAGFEENYDLFFGEPGHMNLIAGKLQETHYQVDIEPGLRYQWQVVAYSSDTSFTSGKFTFRTFPSLALPFFDGFEDYEVNNYVSRESSNWINMNKGSENPDDGRIVDFRRYSGDKSLKIQGNTHLFLGADDFSGKTLNIEYAVLIPAGQIGCTRMTEISGIKMEIYFKINKSADILVNGKVVSSFGYVPGSWFPVKISLSGTRNYLFIQVDGSTKFNQQWKFPNGVIQIKNIEFSGERSPNYPSDGYPLYYIDDLKIWEVQSVTTEFIENTDMKVNVFPNPAGGEFLIQVDPRERIQELSLFNMRGQIVKKIYIKEGTENIRINTEDLPSGMYWLHYISSGRPASCKLVIAR